MNSIANLNYFVFRVVAVLIFNWILLSFNYMAFKLCIVHVCSLWSIYSRISTILYPLLTRAIARVDVLVYKKEKT